ncbi:MAG: S-layer homology domain-containing protein, partial [Candidatus Gracilibacteria bacterium]
MKKILSFLVLTSFFLTTSLAYAGVFPDVDEDHENYKAITYLQEKGVISGNDKGEFKPEGFLNRAEALKIIVNAFAVPLEEDYEILFPDVVKTDWFFKFVMAAKQSGIVKGYDDGNFKPANEV